MDETKDLSVEEQLAPENVKPTKLNKNGKPRKQLDPEALERLAKAREKANAIRKQNTVKKLEEKVEKMKVSQDIAGNQIDPPECAPDPQDIGGNEIEEPEVKVEKIKKKSKKKPQIIIEQSSDDEDEFESNNDRVIFVKRVTRKKKEPVVEPQPPPVIRQEPPPPDIPKPKPVNPLQRQYDAMFSGQFLNQQRMSRR